MSLRNRASLKTTSEAAEKKSSRSAKSRTSRRSAVKRVAAQLVCSDPALAEFLTSPQAPISKQVDAESNADAVTSQKVDTAIKTLGKLEAEVIEALFPTSGMEPETFDDLATRLGMTVEEVKGVADNALRGLRGSRLGGLRISTVWN